MYNGLLLQAAVVNTVLDIEKKTWKIVSVQIYLIKKFSQWLF